MAVRYLMALLVASAAAQQIPPGMHCLELHHGADVPKEQILQCFQQMGVSAAQAEQLVAKVESEGKSVVVAGPKESLDQAAKIFDQIKMTTNVRPLTEADIPSKPGAVGPAQQHPTPARRRLAASQRQLVVVRRANMLALM